MSMLTPPFSLSVPLYSALGLFIVSNVLLGAFLIRRVYRLIHRLQHKPVRHLGIIGSAFRLLLILLGITTSAASLFLFAFIQSYSAFTGRELAAMVYCTPDPGSEDSMILELVTLESPTFGRARQYHLRGQQWTIEGHIVKWDDWLNFFGLRTMYKLTRVRGRYLRAEDEMKGPITAYSLVSNEEAPRWRWLYEYGARLPFIQAVYGNTAFTFPSENKTFLLSVTTSGFMIEEKEVTDLER